MNVNYDVLIIPLEQKEDALFVIYQRCMDSSILLSSDDTVLPPFSSSIEMYPARLKRFHCTWSLLKGDCSEIQQHASQAWNLSGERKEGNREICIRYQSPNQNVSMLYGSYLISEEFERNFKEMWKKEEEEIKEEILRITRNIDTTEYNYLILRNYSVFILYKQHKVFDCEAVDLLEFNKKNFSSEVERDFPFNLKFRNTSWGDRFICKKDDTDIYEKCRQSWLNAIENALEYNPSITKLWFTSEDIVRRMSRSRLKKITTTRLRELLEKYPDRKPSLLVYSSLYEELKENDSSVTIERMKEWYRKERWKRKKKRRLS